MADCDITWKLGKVGVPSARQDGTRWRIRRASMWRPPVSVRRTSVVVPGRHGAINAGGIVYDEPTVSLVFHILGGGSQADLEADVNDLTGMLTAPDLELTRVSGDLVTSAPAVLASINHGNFVAGTVAAVTALLALPDVFLQEEKKTSPQIRPVSGTFPLPLLAGSTAPIPDAVVRITGPATSVTLTDPRASTGLSWVGTLDVGQRLFLDAADLRARIASPSDWASGGANVSGGLDYPAAGPLVLHPRTDTDDPSVRTVELTAATTGDSSNTALAVRAGRSFL